MARNAKQQAAIAISMKAAGKKPSELMKITKGPSSNTNTRGYSVPIKKKKSGGNIKLKK